LLGGSELLRTAEVETQPELELVRVVVSLEHCSTIISAT
jgi:hypothetical protein